MTLKAKTDKRYKIAIRWIVLEDDTDWLDDKNGQPSATVHLVASVWGTSVKEVVSDVRKERNQVFRGLGICQ